MCRAYAPVMMPFRLQGGLSLGFWCVVATHHMLVDGTFNEAGADTSIADVVAAVPTSMLVRIDTPSFG